MLLRQFHCGNDLLTHIRENTDFLQQKPQQLPSAKGNFEGWNKKCVKSMGYTLDTIFS